MGIKTYKPYTASRRNMTGSDFAEVTKKTPEKSLISNKKKHALASRAGRPLPAHLPDTRHRSRATPARSCILL